MNGDAEVADTTTISSDITLTAKYEKEKTGEEEIDDGLTKYTVKIENDNKKGTYTGVSSFEIELGGNVKAAMDKAGVTNPTALTDYTFVGFAFADDEENIINDTTVYNDINKTIIKAVYEDVIPDIVLTLDAEVGLFADGERVKTLKTKEAKELKSFDGYEVPTKEGYVFEKWMDGDAEVADTTTISSNTKLVAKYAVDSTAGGTEEGLNKYTITIENDNTKGTYDGPTSFEVELNGNIKKAMDDAGVVEPSALEDYTFAGFAFEGDEKNIISDTTIYNDTTKSILVAVYNDKTPDITVTLNASVGIFVDGERTKTLTAKEAKELKSFDGYEVPTKEDMYLRNG